MQTTVKDLATAAATILQDLRLFSSLCVARLIVWRTLRSKRKSRVPSQKSSLSIVGRQKCSSGAPCL